MKKNTQFCHYVVPSPKNLLNVEALLAILQP